MGENGKRYVEENYAWSKVLDRLEDGLEACIKK